MCSTLYIFDQQVVKIFVKILLNADDTILYSSASSNLHVLSIAIQPAIADRKPKFNPDKTEYIIFPKTITEKTFAQLSTSKKLNIELIWQYKCT